SLRLAWWLHYRQHALPSGANSQRANAYHTLVTSGADTTSMMSRFPGRVSLEPNNRTPPLFGQLPGEVSTAHDLDALVPRVRAGQGDGVFYAEDCVRELGVTLGYVGWHGMRNYVQGMPP